MCSLDHLGVKFWGFRPHSINQRIGCNHASPLAIEPHTKVVDTLASSDALKFVQFSRQIIRAIFCRVRRFLALKSVLLSFTQLCESRLLIEPQWINASWRQFLAILIWTKVIPCRFARAKYFVAVKTAPSLTLPHFPSSGVSSLDVVLIFLPPSPDLFDEANSKDCLD
jgi:hypothetical protein